MSTSSRSASPLALATGLLLAFSLLWLGYLVMQLRGEVRALDQRSEQAEERLGEVLGEVTRFRVEQRAEGRGMTALMEKIAVYAGALENARTTGPDFQFAQREMDAVLRAIASVGRDAFPPLRQKLSALDPGKEFEHIKWLLEATAVADPDHALDLATKMVQGYHADVKVSARLRWYAGDVLLRLNQPVAQRVLRDILSYESSRGIDPERAAAYKVPTLTSNMASNGFHNFVGVYLRTEDPQTEDTLLMVMGRAEHDLITVQECVKALGFLKSHRAVKAIERAFRNPPTISDNPLFLNHCLDALVDIQGADACPFLEEELRKATNELVIGRIRHHMQSLGC